MKRNVSHTPRLSAYVPPRLIGGGKTPWPSPSVLAASAYDTEALEDDDDVLGGGSGNENFTSAGSEWEW